MSDQSQGPGWWQASDGKWYPPETAPGQPAAAPQPAPQFATTPAPMGTGQLGSRRSLGLIILLSIVTCGIWTIVWSFQNGEELKRYTGNGIGGVGYLFITMFISPVTMFLMAGEVEQMYRAEGNQDPPITTIWGLWFLLPLIGNIIWYVQIQNAINDFWTAHGATDDIGV
ncbi:MAG: DUF4234 domain-containing protein [Acidimicrobiales bacterium]